MIAWIALSVAMPCLPATSLVADEAELSALKNAVPGSHSFADR